MPRPLVATIHISALQHNLQRVRSAAPGAKAWAIVKANAYGHGLARGMRAFANADGLGLIEVDSALHLRELGWRKPILLLEGFFSASDLPRLAEHGIETAVHCDEQIAMLAATNARQPLDVHLKVNSGMNRLGFTPDKVKAAWERLRALPNVGRITFMSHFANADQPDAIVPPVEQMRRFDEATAGLAGERCLANSAAVLDLPAATRDWVRPGIMLYGGSPGNGSAENLGLLPGMTLASEIIGVQTLKAGDAVGYGSRFQADRAMRIGVVACGYADGYPRHAPTGTPILVDGVKTRVVGRVSMDMLMVDLDPVPAAQVGSAVTLWGRGLPIDDVAEAAGTIGYELMCAVAPRVIVREDAA